MKSFGQKLTGRTTRVIGVAAILILTAIIALLIFVPQWQAGHIADDATRLEREDNTRRTLAQIIGGTVGLVIIYITWQRLQVAREELRVAREGQVTERFSRAIEHLGNDSLDVRLGGIYALERIARDSRQDHGPIMEILTAYVREHALWDPPPEDQQPAADEPPPAPPSDMADIQAVLTVLGRRKTDYDPPGQRLDLHYTDLRRANLVKAKLQEANFRGANLQWAFLSEANLQEVIFFNADLQAATLKEANLQGADLGLADLQMAHLIRAKLQGANFKEAKLWGAVLGEAKLQQACLEEADLRQTNIIRANLQKAKFREAKLRRALLEGANLQQAYLEEADLRGTDLRRAKGLTSQQLVEAKGDEDTKLPPGVERPEHWPAEREDAG